MVVMQNQGTIEGRSGIGDAGGNMIDTKSNPKFYRPMTRLDQLLSLTATYQKYLGTT